MNRYLGFVSGPFLSRLVLAVTCTLLLLAGNAFAEKKIFDHSSTGFELDGAHNNSACENCHVGGQFKGTPRQCEGCHSLNGRFNATPKPIDHIPVTQQCESCHQPYAWQGVVLMDHDEVIGPCSQCHNNQITFGQPQDHILTIPQCDLCHSNSLSWVPVAMDHDGVIGSCASCHKPDQPLDHILTSPECDACHTNTLSWQPVMVVDHDEVRGTCSSCHNGIIAKGQFIGHAPTGATECDVCHFTNAFTPQRF